MLVDQEITVQGEVMPQGDTDVTMGELVDIWGLTKQFVQQIVERGYDPTDDMYKMKSMQKKWRAGFTGTELNPAKWDIIQVGDGQTLNVVNGQLQITTGTTALAETIILSKEHFTIPMRAMINVALSQRIANQEFIVELVSVNLEDGEPNSHSCAGWLLDGTSATQAKHFANGGDQPTVVSAAVTITTAAGAGNIMEIEPTADEVWFFTRVLDTTAGRAQSYVRHSQIPNPNLSYKLRITVRNGTVAPASSTTFGSNFANVSDYAELTAEITAGRGSAVAGQSIAAAITSLPILSTVTTCNVQMKSVAYTDTTTNLGAGATFTGTDRDQGSAILIQGKIRARVFASHPGTLYIEQGRTNSTYRSPAEHIFSVLADTVLQVEVPTVTRYWRVRYVNGATTTTTLEVLSVGIPT